jgi:hypothetical protein
MAEILEAKDRIDDLLFIAGHLIDLLEKENLALKQSRIDLVQDSIDQKVKLSRAYEIRVLGMKKSDQDLSDIEPALLEELKNQSKRLQELVEINAKELKISLDTSKMFMGIVADSVKASTPSAGTYGANGSDGVAHGANAKSASLAIDENL